MGARCGRCVLLLWAAACSVPSSDPSITSVLPSEGPDHQAVRIEIEVIDLRLDVAIDYRDPKNSTIDPELRVLIGEQELTSPELIGRNRVEAVVPAGLPQGSYRITVEDGLGRIATKDDAYRVRPATCEELSVCDVIPEVADDMGRTREDRPLMLAPLANDSVAYGTLEITRVTTPAHGQTELLPSGEVHYTPDADYSGDDSFDYEVRSTGGSTASASVHVLIEPVNDPPIASDLALETGPGETLAVELIGSDPEGDPLDFRILSGPEFGTITPANSPSSFVYEAPVANALPAGFVHFTYVANDGQVDSAVATVTIAVRPIWWNVGWSRRRAIVIQPMTGTFTDFPVLVRLDASRIDYSATSSNGRDLRFIAADQSTMLPHQIDTWNPQGTSFVWVTLPAARTGILFWIYYGNPTALSTEQPIAVWDDDHLGVWHLSDELVDSTTGASVRMDSGTDRVRGPIGAGRSFDGTDHIDLGPNVLSSSAGTIMAWMRSPWRDFTYLDHSIAFYGTSSTDPTANGVGNEPELHLGFDPEPTGVFFFFFIEGDPDPDGPDDVRIFSAADGNDGEWHFVVATWDREAGFAELFVDGVSSGNDTHQALQFTSSVTTRLGRPFALDRTFNGALDEVRLLEEPVTADWVAEQHRSMTDALLTHLPDGL